MIFGIFAGILIMKGFNSFVSLYKTMKENEEKRRKKYDEIVDNLNKNIEKHNNDIKENLSNHDRNINQKLADVLSLYRSTSFTEKGNYKTSSSYYGSEESLRRNIDQMNEHDLKKYENLLKSIYDRNIDEKKDEIVDNLNKNIDEKKDIKENLNDQTSNINEKLCCTSFIPLKKF